MLSMKEKNVWRTGIEGREEKGSEERESRREGVGRREEGDRREGEGASQRSFKREDGKGVYREEENKREDKGDKSSRDV